MFDLLLGLGADASYWQQTSLSSPSSKTHSATARSTPLHLAIQGGHETMIKHLLQLDFNPSLLPLVNPATATTPLMASIVCHAIAPSAYALLSNHPLADFQVHTPYCKAHMAHFAVASFNTEALEDLVRRQSCDLAITTALGQNLLHLAFLPMDNIDLVDSPAKQASLRGSRSTALPYMSDSSGRRSWDKGQERIIDWLSARCPELVVGRDVFGNTPLHYHACSWSDLKNLPQALQVHASTMDVWENAKNAQGYTPRELSLA